MKNEFLKVLYNLISMMKNLTGIPTVYSNKERKVDILIKNKKYLIVYFITIPIYAFAISLIITHIVPLYKEDFLLPTMFICMILFVTSFIELIPKKALINFLQKKSVYPYNSIVNMQHKSFFLKSYTNRYNMAKKALEHSLMGEECDAEFIKYYFYKHEDLKSFDKIEDIAATINYYSSNYVNDLKTRHEKISELFPYGIEEHKNYFANKAAKDFGPSYFNIFYYLYGIFFTISVVLIFPFRRKK